MRAKGITILMVKRRTQAWVRIVLFGAAVLVWSSSPLTVSAAEVVDLRIGVHPDYTRVVFELDRPTAYKVLQGSGQSELVVRLQADSISRKIKSSNSLIGLIQIEPTATGSREAWLHAALREASACPSTAN